MEAKDLREFNAARSYTDWTRIRARTNAIQPVTDALLGDAAFSIETAVFPVGEITLSTEKSFPPPGRLVER